MKVHDSNQLLLESVTLTTSVESVEDLIDPKTNRYYSGEVNVTGDVDISGINLSGIKTYQKDKLEKIPVEFGTVGGSFYCTHHNLKTLKNAPKKVHGSFFCSANKLTSLEDAPQEIGASFNCSNNKINSLEGIHKIIKKINGAFILDHNPIKSGSIGLLLIEGITRIYGNPPAFKIINKYLGQGKAGLLRCQEELIEAGFDEYAKL